MLWYGRYYCSNTVSRVSLNYLPPRVRAKILLRSSCLSGRRGGLVDGTKSGCLEMRGGICDIFTLLYGSSKIEDCMNCEYGIADDTGLADFGEEGGGGKELG